MVSLCLKNLKKKIRSYNEKYSSVGGRATLQIFDSMKSIDDGETSDCGDSGEPPIKRKCTIQPMIVTVCTPMMARAHQYLPQAAEVIYCDSTSSLDRFNTSVFLLSTNHAGGSIPLGIALTSDEKESTLHSALSDLKKVWPQNAFYNTGTETGLKVILTDDSIAEQMLYSQCGLCQLCCFAHSTFCRDGGLGFTMEKTKLLNQIV